MVPQLFTEGKVGTARMGGWLQIVRECRRIVSLSWCSHCAQKDGKKSVCRARPWIGNQKAAQISSAVDSLSVRSTKLHGYTLTTWLLSLVMNLTTELYHIEMVRYKNE